MTRNSKNKLPKPGNLNYASPVKPPLMNVKRHLDISL